MHKQARAAPPFRPDCVRPFPWRACRCPDVFSGHRAAAPKHAQRHGVAVATASAESTNGQGDDQNASPFLKRGAGSRLFLSLRPSVCQEEEHVARRRLGKDSRSGRGNMRRKLWRLMVRWRSGCLLVPGGTSVQDGRQPDRPRRRQGTGSVWGVPGAAAPCPD